MTVEAIYDVFLSHAGRDKPAVEDLARRLNGAGLAPFLDKWHLVPGEPWQEALEEALDRSRTCAVFLGPGGLGPWQNEEMRVALSTRVRDKSHRVMPVLLPGSSMPEQMALPRFLQRLNWVDFRAGLDDSQAFHRLVCGIKGIPPGDGAAGSSAHPSPLPAPTLIGVPHRNPFFTGRESLLGELHQRLQATGITALAQAAIHGLGGIGKTQTAIEYVHRFGKHYRFVLWVAAEQQATLGAAYLSIARELGLVEGRDDLETGVRALKAWLSREERWLLVFDNADDPALLRDALPVVRAGGKVLLTSRAKTFAEVGIREPFRVETMDPEDARAFLLKRTKREESEPAAELARELGYLPLALEQAAAYVDTVGVSLREYLASFQRRGLKLLEKGKPGAEYPASVATTWNLSFTNVQKASPASAELLTAAAFLAPDLVPIEIFTLGCSELDGLLAEALKGVAAEPLVFWELLEPLERYSLVERLPDDAFQLHRLTQEVVKDSLGEAGRRMWAERVIRALNTAYPDLEFENWKLCERLQPNARPAAELTRTYKLESIEAGRLLLWAGHFAWVRGDYAGARLCGELALEIRERVLGGEHPDTLTAMNDLALTLDALEDLPGALRLYERTLEIRERVLGREHADTLTSMNNLAGTLRDLSDLAGARDLNERTLEIRERVLGAEHPDTLTSRMWRGQLLADEDRFQEAREVYGEVLEIQRRVLGEEHPATTVSTWNLLWIVRKLNDGEAEAQLIDRLRWLLDRDEESLPSADQKTIRQDLIGLLDPS
jgi:tetratricopeptide (TPR) repeat protein